MPNSPSSPLDDLSDAELASLAARRDAERGVSAFRTLHGRYAARVLPWLATRLGPEGIEEKARRYWSRVWDALGRPDEFDGQEFSTLLLQVARRPELGIPEGPAAPRDSSRSDALAAGLAGLHTGERVVVELRLGGLTFEEIATRAKSTAERAQKVFEAARKKLNAGLEPPPS